MNPYIICPTYETGTLCLRLVTMEDAHDLLKCYSDSVAVAKMNADNCINDFYYPTLSQMQDAIAMWLREYEKQMFIRFSIVPKEYKKAVGTVEMFGGNFPKIGRAGVLRIDLATEHEVPEVISELTALAIGSFISDFNIDAILIKAAHTTERAKVFKDYGFAPTDKFRPGLGYYAYKNKALLTENLHIPAREPSNLPGYTPEGHRAGSLMPCK